MIGHPNLKLWLRFEGGVIDATGNCALTNSGATFTTGNKGQALNINSETNYLNFTSFSALLMDYTQKQSYCFWIKRPSNADANHIAIYSQS